MRNLREYEGYSNDCDEWRYKEELETLGEETQHSTPYKPYSVYNALCAKRKLLTVGLKFH
jgi:hypothetical protein